LIKAFCQRWKVHALDQAKMFFGISSIQDWCVTLDQTHKVRELVSEVFCPNHDQQTDNKGYSTPMIAGTEHANDLAACTPYAGRTCGCSKTNFWFCILSYPQGVYAFCFMDEKRHSHGLSSARTISIEPGSLHFRALKHLVGYLRLHPDIPLVFQRSTTPQEVSAMNFSILDPPTEAQEAQVNAFTINVIPMAANISFDSDPISVTSCENFYNKAFTNCQ
jgi:hypothetical protein